MCLSVIEAVSLLCRSVHDRVTQIITVLTSLCQRQSDTNHHSVHVKPLALWLWLVCVRVCVWAYHLVIITALIVFLCIPLYSSVFLYIPLYPLYSSIFLLIVFLCIPLYSSIFLCPLPSYVFLYIPLDCIPRASRRNTAPQFFYVSFSFFFSYLLIKGAMRGGSLPPI